MLVRGLIAAFLTATAVAGCAQASHVAGPAGPAPTSASPSAGPSPTASPSPSATPSAAAASRAGLSSAPSAPATSPGGKAIPWLDQAVPKVVLPDQDPDITHPVLYRPCIGPMDVQARAKGWGAGMGTMAEFIYLTNVSATPCSLAGSVTSIVGVDGPHQHVFPLRTGGMGHPPDAVANLKPGQSGWMQITQQEDCATDPNAPAFLKVILDLPGGGEVALVGTRTTAPQAGCELGITPFGTTHVTPPEPTYPTDPIKASLTAPATVRSGHAFDYTVTLTNPTSKAIALTPCPSYEETAFRKPDPHPDDATYQLNCAGHTALEPGESLTFAIRTAGITPTGMGQVFWHLQNSNVYAAAQLNVTAS